MSDTARKMTDLSVPVGVVTSLKKLPGGMDSIADDLKQNHQIDTKFEGSDFRLTGPYETILDIALEFLHVQVGRANKSNKTLGGKGTVAWSYRGKPVKLLKGLFHEEYKELLKLKSLKTSEPKADCLDISCSYADYQTVNDMLEKLDKNIKNCKQETVKVNVKEQQLAKKFENEQNSNAFYCCLLFDKKDKSKVVLLEFNGREQKHCQEGIAMWESTKKAPTSSFSSTTTFKKTVKVSSTTQEQKTTDQPNMTSSLKGTASASLLEKQAKNTNVTVPVNKQETMDADWDDAATGLSSTDLTNLSKPQMNTSSSAGASGGPNENIYSRAATTDVKKTPGRMLGSGDTAKYSFGIGNIVVYVYKQSITEIKGMDAITNAANEGLMHGGGVAYFISKAAGKKMDEDCNKHIIKNGRLQVTQNFVSVSGDMKCKGIIHAVGPTWYDYKDKREDCAKALYETITNILITANSKKWQKVALSAISSGIFGVPKKLCAEMYIKAFADYASGGADGTVKEVHFIDLNREILDIVIEAHKRWTEDASKLEFKNALEYSPVMSKKKTRKDVGSVEQDSLIQSLGADQTSYGETRHKFRVCTKLTVYVYKGSLTRLSGVDAIAMTISPDPRQKGILEGAVQYLAGHKYAREVDKYRNGKNGTVFVTSETGNLPCKKVVHVISSPIRRLDKASLSTLSEVYCRALTQKSNVRSLGMPVFGTGGASSKVDVQTLCFNVIETLISVCSDTNVTLTVEELHLVNLDGFISSCLRDQFTGVITNGTEKKTYKQTTYYPSNTARSNHIDHRWMEHTPLEAIEHAKAKPVFDGQGKNKVSQQNAHKTIEKAPANKKCVYCSDKMAEIKLKECNHMYCSACAIPVKTSAVCLKCSTSSEESKGKYSKTGENCPVCLEQMTETEVLPCSHKLCQVCYDAVKKQKPQCPTCQHIFGEITGNQPDGNMFYRYVSWKSLPGYDGCGTIEICYIIPGDKQRECHPHPDKPYRGIERHAYLPDNKEGQEILHLLRRAFDKKLVFTIGESRTTGKEDVVTWNDIHHKTRPTGGPDRFGYPDSTYLSRVREELAAKGVTE